MRTNTVLLITLMLILIALPLASFTVAASNPIQQIESTTIINFATEETADEAVNEDENQQGIDLLVLLAGLAGIGFVGVVMGTRSRSAANAG